MVNETNRSLESFRKDAQKQGLNWIKTQTIFENRMSQIKTPKILPKQKDANIYLRRNRLDQQKIKLQNWKQDIKYLDHEKDSLLDRMRTERIQNRVFSNRNKTDRESTMLLEEGTISQDESKISVKSLKIAKKFQRPTVMDPKI